MAVLCHVDGRLIERSLVQNGKPQKIIVILAATSCFYTTCGQYLSIITSFFTEERQGHRILFSTPSQATSINRTILTLEIGPNILFSSFIENRLFFSCTISWLQFALALLIIVPPLPSGFTSFFLSLIKKEKGFNKIIKRYKVKCNNINQKITSNLDKTTQRKRVLGEVRRIRDLLQSQIQESYRNTKLEPIIHTQRTWCWHMSAPFLLLQSLWVHIA